jgi:hypothetical protein
MAAIQKVIAFRMMRMANRKIIIADLKNVKSALADLRAACQAIDGSCQVEMSAVAKTKRADATNAYVVVGCEKTDATCDLAVNTMLAGAVDAETDVSVTETTADEIAGLPSFPDEAVTTVGTTGAGKTDATKTSSAATLAVSVAALLVAVLTL